MEESASIKLNLEHHKKSTLCCISVTAFVSFVVCVIVAITTSPAIIGESSVTYFPCSPTIHNRCYDNSFPENDMYISVDLEKYNQIFYLIADFTSASDISSNLNYSVLIRSESYTGNNTQTVKYSNQTFALSCSHGSCDYQLIFYQPYIDYTRYTVKIALFGNIPVDSIKFSIKYITNDFTQYFLGTKYFFLALSIFSMLWCWFNLYRVGNRFWSTESALVGILSFNLFLFDEPFLALTLKELSVGWSGISVFCNAQFAAFLLLFWFLNLHSEFKKTYWVLALVAEGLFVCIFFVLLMVLYMYTTVQLKFKPTFSWQHDLPSETKGVFAGIVFFLTAFAVWLTVLIIYSVIKFKNAGGREKLMKVSVMVMLLITIVMLGVGAFQPLPRSGSLLLISVSLYNIYIYVFTWLYTPSYESYKMLKTERKFEQDATDPNVTVVNSDKGTVGNKI